MEKASHDGSERFGADDPPAAAAGSRVAAVPIGVAPTADLFYAAAKADQVLPVGFVPPRTLFNRAPGSPVGTATSFPPSFLPFIAETPLLYERSWPPRATSSSAPGSQRNHLRAAAPFVLTQATAEESAPMASQRNHLRAEPAPFEFPPAIAQWSAPMASHCIQLPDQAIGKGGVPLGSQHKQLPFDAPAFAPSEMKPKFGLKTVICKYWKQGKCRSEDGCRFAHGEEELLRVDSRASQAELRARRYKTASCKRWQADDPMACPDGVNCLFAHGPQELRDADRLPAVCCFSLAGKACPRDGCPLRHCI